MEVFRHIRYATAERFEAPVQTGFSEGTVAWERPTGCPQGPFRLGFLMKETEPMMMSEDCQFLNIWTPSPAGKFPVLVWIHGGAYIAGTGEEAAYDGGSLCHQGNIVVVAVSYRVGAFGYLYSEEKGISNLGLKDQMAALRWVKANISRFGGDENRITVAGQSAGGHSVAAIISSCNEPLFHKAIIQSAPLGMRCKRKEAKVLYSMILDVAGKPLDTLSTEELLEAQQAVMKRSRSMMSFSPVEPDFTGRVSVPSLERVLVTWQKDDASPFVALALNRQERFGNVIDKIATRIATEKVFGSTARKYAKVLNAAGVPTETRCLDWRPEGSPFGACHCLELSLLFGSWERWQGAQMLGSTSHQAWKEKAQEFREEYITFIR